MAAIIQAVKHTAEVQSKDSQASIIHLATAVTPFLESGAFDHKGNAAFATSEGKLYIPSYTMTL